MSGRRKIEDRIRKKEQEISELEAQIREGRAYIQALNDALKILPKDGGRGNETADLRPGSMVAEAKRAIETAGKPLHISELLEVLGKEKSRKNRASLGGSLAAYVRKGEIFTRPKPNTFGLIGMDFDAGSTREKPPADFGNTPELDGDDDDDVILVDDGEIPF